LPFPDTEYKFKVKAGNHSGQTRWSEEFRCRTLRAGQGRCEAGSFLGSISISPFERWENNILLNPETIGILAQFKLEDHNKTANMNTRGGRITLTNTKKQNYWQVQAKKVGLKLKNNQEYFCEISMQSDKENVVFVEIGQDVSPWKNFGCMKYIKVGTENKKHSFKFKTKNNPNLHVKNVKFTIYAGEMVGKLDINKISLLEMPKIEQTSILKNGTFEASGAYPFEWELEDHNGTATMSIDETGGINSTNAVIVENSKKQNFWQIQLNQTGIPIEDGNIYRYSFFVKGNQNGAVFAEIGRAAAPYDNFGLFQYVRVTTDWKKHEFEFIAINNPELDEEHVKYTIHLGEYDGRIWFDNLGLVEE